MPNENIEGNHGLSWIKHAPDHIETFSTTLDPAAVHARWEIQTDQERYLNILSTFNPSALSIQILEYSADFDSETKLSRLQKTGREFRNSPTTLNRPPHLSVNQTHQNGDDQNMAQYLRNEHSVVVDDDPGLLLLYEHVIPTPRAPSIASRSSSPATNGLAIEALAPSPIVPIPTPIIVTASSSSSEDEANSEQPVLFGDTVGRPGPPRQRAVRFRSRVRIGSGIHPSTDSSASSSFSVPLRSPSVEGKQAVAATHSPRRAVFFDATLDVPPMSVPIQRPPKPRSRLATPQSSLTKGSRRRLYTDPYAYDQDLQQEDDSDNDRLHRARTAALKTEEDVIYGEWPWRMLNRYVSVSS
ncbi:hypothetical protein SISSUDRAFT_850741 [Sistotremastrum suecicum HHB10207 ss-3]|uniref:Uncharacterized protein n=1 Tax=Sistotremastrum suecicum HHB10207 ss-3 TaxID=1314776 RepID=A0A166HL89_9AGAM|nr:hypothetical protein SISSUDRAFT_850741 [Sistotremastrum suecicum HHB10207 ss-3]